MPQQFKVAMHEMRGQMLEKNNEDVQEFVNTAHLLLKTKGWKYEGQRLISALYERRYTRGEFSVTVGGWHGGGKRGTSRFYGASKSFLDLFYSRGFKQLSKVEAKLHDCDTFEELIAEQARAMEEALKFIAQV